MKASLALTCANFSTQLTSVRAQPAFSASDLCYWSAARLAQAIREKAVSSEEVVRAHFDRISSVNGKINAVVQLASDRALAEAVAADAALARGETLGPLHGVPMTIKDSFDTEGIISTAGTKGRARFVPSRDATVVARLRAAGAILLAKTNTPEFTFAGATENLVYGRTNNPFDLSRTVGGSSGGAAAIVAVGGSPVDIGTDTVASVRWPAHCCGVTSIKPTSGRASLAGHIVGSSSPIGMMTQPGPIARYVEDLALILPIISGADLQDAQVEDRSLGDADAVDLRSLRICFYTKNGITTPATEIIETVRGAATALSSMVKLVEEKAPAVLPQGAAIANDMFAATGREFFRGLLQASGTSTNEIGPAMRYLTNELPQMSSEQKERVLVRRDAFKAGLLSLMGDYDVILCPVNSRIAPTHGVAATSDDTSYTDAYNLAGFPAATVRAGTSSQGLPIGVQIVGRPWEEHVVLAVARFLESALGGWRPVPRAVLTIQRAPGSSTIFWTGYGTLEEAAAIDGPWSKLPEARAPYRLTNALPSRFYRVGQ